MKGLNVLLLNEATMVEAVQYYLDGMIVANSETVKSITWNGSAFRVAIEESDGADERA